MGLQSRQNLSNDIMNKYNGLLEKAYINYSALEKQVRALLEANSQAESAQARNISESVYVAVTLLSYEYDFERDLAMFTIAGPFAPDLPSLPPGTSL